MHELSLALNIADEIIRIAKENNARNVLSANLRIGRGAGIVMDSLIFALEIVKMQYPMLSLARIEIDEIPLIYRCNDCYKEFEGDGISIYRCPGCGSYGLMLVSGEELEIGNIEIEVQ